MVSLVLTFCFIFDCFIFLKRNKGLEEGSTSMLVTWKAEWVLPCLVSLNSIVEGLSPSLPAPLQWAGQGVPVTYFISVFYQDCLGWSSACLSQLNYAVTQNC